MNEAQVRSVEQVRQVWGLAVMLASIVSPLTYGLVTWLTGGDHRSAMLATGLYFVIGLALLYGIDAERGRRAALAADAQALKN